MHALIGLLLCLVIPYACVASGITDSACQLLTVLDSQLCTYLNSCLIDCEVPGS